MDDLNKLIEFFYQAAELEKKIERITKQIHDEGQALTDDKKSLKKVEKHLERLYLLDKKASHILSIDAQDYQSTSYPREFREIHNLALDYEKQTPKGYITDTTPLFGHEFDQLIKGEDAESAIMDDLVKRVRVKQQLSIKINPQQQSFKELPMTNTCFLTTYYVRKIADEQGIKCQGIYIGPGFLKQEQIRELTPGGYYHFFNIVQINGHNKIVDCSYRQYFDLYQNHLQRLGMVYSIGPKVGTFMMMTPERRELAQTLLQRGWIDCTPENLKLYLDGFALFYRNGLYYEQTKDFSYTTDYTPDDYIKFLLGEDSQLNHESPETLGFQKKALKNYKMVF